MAVFNEITLGGCIVTNKDANATIITIACLDRSVPRWKRVAAVRWPPKYGIHAVNNRRIKRFAYIPSIIVCNQNLIIRNKILVK